MKIDVTLAEAPPIPMTKVTISFGSFLIDDGAPTPKRVEVALVLYPSMETMAIQIGGETNALGGVHKKDLRRMCDTIYAVVKQYERQER